MRLADLKINPRFEQLLGKLTADEYTQLDRNISSNGYDEAFPMTVWNNIVVDGHNRYRICKFHGIEDVPVIKKEFANDDEAEKWMIENQLARRSTPDGENRDELKRHLNAYKRSALALKAKPLIAEKAKEKQSTHTEQGYQKSDKAVNTSKALAKLANVSHDTIHKVEVVENSQNEEAKNKARSGEWSVNKAYNAVKEQEEEKRGVRKCQHCGKLLPLSAFPDPTHKYRCNDCRNRLRREIRAMQQVMPDTLNPDVKEEITDDIIIDKFANILADAESSFRMLLKYETKMTNAIREALVVTINEHMGKMNILKGEIKNETEGQNI